MCLHKTSLRICGLVIFSASRPRIGAQVGCASYRRKKTSSWPPAHLSRQEREGLAAGFKQCLLMDDARLRILACQRDPAERSIHPIDRHDAQVDIEWAARLVDSDPPRYAAAKHIQWWHFTIDILDGLHVRTGQPDGKLLIRR